MTEDIGWLAELREWDFTVVFARGVEPAELAQRLSVGRAVPVARPLTEAQARKMAWSGHSEDYGAASVARAGQSAGWSFALEYGAPVGSYRLGELSQDGSEAVVLSSWPEHPPAQFEYARDGRLLCAFGIGEERIRHGEDRDLLLPAFVSEGLLKQGGTEYTEENDEMPHHRRRCLTVIGTHFGLSLPQDWLDVTPMPAYVVNGTADTFLFDRSPADDAVRMWARANGYLVNDNGRVPAAIREAYEKQED